MNPWWLTLAGVGLVVVWASVMLARRPTISPIESRVFHAVNGLPGWLFPLFWPPMQLGNLVVGTVAGWVVAVLDRDITVAVGVLFGPNVSRQTVDAQAKRLGLTVVGVQPSGLTGGTLIHFRCRRQAAGRRRRARDLEAENVGVARRTTCIRRCRTPALAARTERAAPKQYVVSKLRWARFIASRPEAMCWWR